MSQRGSYQLLLVAQMDGATGELSAVLVCKKCRNPRIGAPGNAPNNGNSIPGTPPHNGNNPGTIPPGNGDNGGINNNNPGKNTWNGPGNLTNNGAWHGQGDFNTNSNTDPGIKDGGIGNH